MTKFSCYYFLLLIFIYFIFGSCESEIFNFLFIFVFYLYCILGLLWDLKSPKVALSRLGQKTPKLSLEDKLPHFNTLKTNMNDYFHNYSVFTGLLIFVSDSTGIIW